MAQNGTKAAICLKYHQNLARKCDKNALIINQLRFMIYHSLTAIVIT